ncbi:hypothetical protein ABFA07_002429 [Porites harrisoni]
MCRYWRFLLLCNFAVINFTTTTDAVKKSDDDELRLVKDLFNNYSKEVRPVKNKKAAIKVIFGIAYTQLVELDEKNQVLVSNVWIRQKWNNHLLRWNASNYGGIKSNQRGSRNSSGFQT